MADMNTDTIASRNPSPTTSTDRSDPPTGADRTLAADQPLGAAPTPVAHRTLGGDRPCDADQPRGTRQPSGSDQPSAADQPSAPDQPSAANLVPVASGLRARRAPAPFALRPAPRALRPSSLRRSIASSLASPAAPGRGNDRPFRSSNFDLRSSAGGQPPPAGHAQPTKTSNRPPTEVSPTNQPGCPPPRPAPRAPRPSSLRRSVASSLTPPTPPGRGNDRPFRSSNFALRSSDLSRRDFVRTAAAAAAGATLVPARAADYLELLAQQHEASSKPAPELAIGVIGAGSQGGNLINKCLKIPGIRIIAVCDIWPYWLRRFERLLKRYKMPIQTYQDYREMLAREKHLDAVIVATPDWMHAEHTIACLEAGKHVYCEKEMSNSIELARKMVHAARRTGKLLQIGHQRRSNPRYWHAIKLIEKDRICGRITHCYGQWNRARLLERGWPKKYELDAETLRRYGYENMHQLRNWRWYRRFSGGPMADLGSHQVDVFCWFLKTPPAGVTASGGTDYYKCEWYDNVMAIYEFQTKPGLVRGFYQVLNTTSHGGFYETFMGDEGSLVISEDPRKGYFFREMQARRREWEAESETKEIEGREAFELKLGQTLAPGGGKDPEAQRLLEESKKPVHQLHLENFFNAIRHGTPLTCPPEVAFETCVAVLRTNDAVASNCRLTYDPQEFHA